VTVAVRRQTKHKVTSCSGLACKNPNPQEMRIPVRTTRNMCHRTPDSCSILSHGSFAYPAFIYRSGLGLISTTIFVLRTLLPFTQLLSRWMLRYSVGQTFRASWRSALKQIPISQVFRPQRRRDVFAMRSASDVVNGCWLPGSTPAARGNPG
jgi:hypothetical protein